MKKILLIIVLAVALVGCSNGDSGERITKNDMCIIHVDSKDKICYGDTREKAEKVTGVGVESFARDMYDYDFGVTLAYRDDNVVAITLKEESKGVYKTGRGSSIGDSKASLKSTYSVKYALDKAEHNLDYFYDTEKKVFLGDTSLSTKATQEEMEKTYVVSFMFDSDSNATSIMLLDRKFAMLLQ